MDPGTYSKQKNKKKKKSETSALHESSSLGGQYEKKRILEGYGMVASSVLKNRKQNWRMKVERNWGKIQSDLQLIGKGALILTKKKPNPTNNQGKKT